MDSEVEKKYIIRYYSTPETYETLGVATGKNNKDAIEAYLHRRKNQNETRQLTADEVTETDFRRK